MDTTILNKVIDDFKVLSIEDKEYAIELIRKQLIEAKRESLNKREKEAMTNLKRGLVKKGTVKELYKDLESD